MEESLKQIVALLQKEPTFLESLTTYLTIASLISSFIVLGVAVYAARQVKLAAEQIRVSREIARIQATRDSIKEATELCDKFERDIIPLTNKINKNNGRQIANFEKIKIISLDPPKYDDSEAKNWVTEFANKKEEILTILNKLESFSIPFITQIADEKVAFLPLSKTFCETAKRFFPVIIDYNRNHRHYANTLTLLQKWDTQNRSLDLTIQKKINEFKNKQIDSQLEGMTQPENNPIGTKI